MRQAAGDILGSDVPEGIAFEESDLESALLVGRALSYAQGFRILKAASDEFDWNLEYSKIAEVWRAGCIIRSAMLDDISTSFKSDLPHGRLILSNHFATLLKTHISALRRVVATATLAGLPVPALSSAVSWYDEIRQPRGTANMIQGQRDFFGAHGFEIVGRGTDQHGKWPSTIDH